MSFEEDEERFAKDKHLVRELMIGCPDWDKPGHHPDGVGTENLLKYMIEVLEDLYNGEEYIGKLIKNLKKTLKDYQNRYNE